MFLFISVTSLHSQCYYYTAVQPVDADLDHVDVDGPVSVDDLVDVDGPVHVDGLVDLDAYVDVQDSMHNSYKVTFFIIVLVHCIYSSMYAHV